LFDNVVMGDHHKEAERECEDDSEPLDLSLKTPKKFELNEPSHNLEAEAASEASYDTASLEGSTVRGGCIDGHCCGELAGQQRVMAPTNLGSGYIDTNNLKVKYR
jgi:hypothetical protein